MNIQKITYAQSFGKTPLMHCTVKRAMPQETPSKKTKKQEDKKQEKIAATLYQLDPRIEKDMQDASYSKTAYVLSGDMNRDAHRFYPISEYFILTNDKTGEVISCAQTSKRYRLDDKKIPGYYMLVEEFNTSRNYTSPAEPMFAFLTDKAFKHNDTSIVIGTYDIEGPELKKSRFTLKKNGEWYMPERRFNDFFDTAQKRYDIVI